LESIEIEQRISSTVMEMFKALPISVDSLRIDLGSRPTGFRYSPYIVNLHADLESHSVMGTGEAISVELAQTKAVSELIERLVFIDWSAKVPRSAAALNSNGWAAHPNRKAACVNAALELVERDAVLKHWFSSTPFVEIDSNTFPVAIKQWIDDELKNSEFPILRLLISTEGVLPTATVLLLNSKGMGVTGHASRTDLSEAVSSALGEACRAAHHAIRRSFWKDSKALALGEMITVLSPGVHSVYYAYVEAFPKWMFENIVDWESALADWKDRFGTLEDKINEFTFIEIASLPIFVGYASHPQCIDLKWGATISNRIAVGRGSSFIEFEKINFKPHIVA
jgi:hypothetical protein